MMAGDVGTSNTVRKFTVSLLSVDLLAALLSRYAGPLALYARQWCDEPDDVVQTAFLQLARQDAPPSDPPAWLYRAVRNGAISAQRSAGRRRRREQAAAQERSGWFQVDEEGARNAVDETAKAVAALTALDDELREVVTAHLWGGLSFEQIAAVVGTSSSTAHRRYRQGLERLRTELELSCKTRTD